MLEKKLKIYHMLLLATLKLISMVNEYLQFISQLIHSAITLIPYCSYVHYELDIVNSTRIVLRSCPFSTIAPKT